MASNEGVGKMQLLDYDPTIRLKRVIHPQVLRQFIGRNHFNFKQDIPNSKEIDDDIESLSLMVSFPLSKLNRSLIRKLRSCPSRVHVHPVVDNSPIVKLREVDKEVGAARKQLKRVIVGSEFLSSGVEFETKREDFTSPKTTKHHSLSSRLQQDHCYETLKHNIPINPSSTPPNSGVKLDGSHHQPDLNSKHEHTHARRESTRRPTMLSRRRQRLRRKQQVENRLVSSSDESERKWSVSHHGDLCIKINNFVTKKLKKLPLSVTSSISTSGSPSISSTATEEEVSPVRPIPAVTHFVCGTVANDPVIESKEGAAEKGKPKWGKIGGRKRVNGIKKMSPVNTGKLLNRGTDRAVRYKLTGNSVKRVKKKCVANSKQTKFYPRRSSAKFSVQAQSEGLGGTNTNTLTPSVNIPVCGQQLAGAADTISDVPIRKKLNRVMSNEDSGYPHSLSSSDGSTRSSRAPDSKSPVDVTPGAPCNEMFPDYQLDDGNGGSEGLIWKHQDPNLHSSNSILELNFAESTGGLLEDASVNLNNVACSAAEQMLLDHRQEDETIFPKLEQVLNQNINSEIIFDPGELLVYKPKERETSCEMDGYKLDSIMGSESVCEWLKKIDMTKAESAYVNEVDPCNIDVDLLCSSILSIGAPDPMNDPVNDPMDDPMDDPVDDPLNHPLNDPFKITSFEEETSPSVKVAAIVTVESSQEDPAPVIKCREGRPKKRRLSSIEERAHVEKKRPRLESIEQTSEIIKVENLEQGKSMAGRSIKPSWKVTDGWKKHTLSKGSQISRKGVGVDSKQTMDGNIKEHIQVSVEHGPFNTEFVEPINTVTIGPLDTESVEPFNTVTIGPLDTESVEPLIVDSVMVNAEAIADDSCDESHGCGSELQKTPVHSNLFSLAPEITNCMGGAEMLENSRREDEKVRDVCGDGQLDANITDLSQCPVGLEVEVVGEKSNTNLQAISFTGEGCKKSVTSSECEILSGAMAESDVKNDGVQVHKEVDGPVMSLGGALPIMENTFEEEVSVISKHGTQRECLGVKKVGSEVDAPWSASGEGRVEEDEEKEDGKKRSVSTPSDDNSKASGCGPGGGVKPTKSVKLVVKAAGKKGRARKVIKVKKTGSGSSRNKSSGSRKTPILSLKRFPPSKSVPEPEDSGDRAVIEPEDSGDQAVIEPEDSGDQASKVTPQSNITPVVPKRMEGSKEENICQLFAEAPPTVIELETSEQLGDNTDMDFNVDEVIRSMDFDPLSPTKPIQTIEETIPTAVDTTPTRDPSKTLLTPKKKDTCVDNVNSAKYVKSVAAVTDECVHSEGLSTLDTKSPGRSTPVGNVRESSERNFCSDGKTPPTTKKTTPNMSAKSRVSQKHVRKVILPSNAKLKMNSLSSLKEVTSKNCKKSAKNIVLSEPSGGTPELISIKQESPGETDSMGQVMSEISSPKPEVADLEEDCIDLYADDDFSAEVSGGDPLARIFHQIKDKVTNKNQHAVPNELPLTSSNLRFPLSNQRFSSSSQLSSRLAQKSSDLNLRTTNRLIGQQPFTKHIGHSSNVVGAGNPTTTLSGIIPFGAHHLSVQHGKMEAPPTLPVFTGGLMSRHGRLQATRQAASVCNGSDNPLQPLTMKNSFLDNTDINSIPSSSCLTSSQDSYTTDSQYTSCGYCHLFLKDGRCRFGSRCRYKHAGRDTVPLNVLEKVVLSQPCQMIPMDVTQRYASDHHSLSLLQANFSDFIEMIHNILKMNLDRASSGFNFLSSLGIKFSGPFLCHLLDMFGSHTHHVFIDVILKSLSGVGGPISPDNYLKVFRIMASHKKFSELKDVYADMRKKSSPTLAIITYLVRFGKDLGEWTFQLLDDVKLSDTKDGAWRFINRFVNAVDYQLLLKESHIQKIISYLESFPSVAGRLNVEAFNKLSGALSSCQMWDQLVYLLHSCLRIIPNTRKMICETLESTIRHVGVSEKTMNIIERLTEEQKSGLSNEVWNKVMVTCIRNGHSQRAIKLYTIITRLSKQLSDEVMISMMELFDKHNNPSMAMIVLHDGLKRTPSIIPSLPLLTSLASSLDTLNSSQDLHLIVTSLIHNLITPPLDILQMLLKFYSKDKCYSKLAEVVKLAKDYRVTLDKTFYQSVLEDLSQWGQDQEALSVVSDVLKEVQGRGEGTTGNSDLSGNNPTSSFNTTASTTSLHPAVQRDVAEVITLSQPTTLTAAVLKQPFNDIEAVVAVGGIASVPSLEEVIDQSPGHEDIHELTNLIKRNGKLGQFRAVAAILVDMGSTSIQYDEPLVHSIWEAIASSKLKSANVFSLFLSHLDQSRFNTLNSMKCNVQRGSSLLPSDRWLVSQVGIALVKLCEMNADWQSGFVILHHLHRFGIHYVKMSQPASTLPPLSPTPLSPCSVALMAVNVCLHVDKDTNSALEVLRGCNWVKATNAAELHSRTEIITTLAQRCLDGSLLRDTWMCLDAISSGKIMKKFLHSLTNLHNKLLQSILDARDIQFALVVFRSMKKAGLQYLPSVFSDLLHILCETDELSLAKELCESAISDSCYAPLTRGNLFEIMFPLGVTKLELQLLLEDHLKKLTLDITKERMRNLVIHLSPSSREILEQVLSEFVPKLSAKFESRVVTITSGSLVEWCSANDVCKVMKSKKDDKICSSLESNKVCSATKLNGIGKSLERDQKFEDTEKDVSPLTEEAPVVYAVQTEAAKGTKEKVKGDPISEIPDAQQLLKVQKEAVCREFVEKLKQHCKTRFRTKSDYTHFLKALSNNFFKTSKTFAAACQQKVELNEVGKWYIPNAVRQEIGDTVSSVLSKFSVYSRDQHDDKLGFTTAKLAGKN